MNDTRDLSQALRASEREEEELALEAALSDLSGLVPQGMSQSLAWRATRAGLRRGERAAVLGVARGGAQHGLPLGGEQGER